jgi:hypothetical protein
LRWLGLFTLCLRLRRWRGLLRRRGLGLSRLGLRGRLLPEKRYHYGEHCQTNEKANPHDFSPDAANCPGGFSQKAERCHRAFLAAILNSIGRGAPTAEIVALASGHGHSP